MHLFAKCSLISVTSSSSHWHRPLCHEQMGQGLQRLHTVAGTTDTKNWVLALVSIIPDLPILLHLSSCCLHNRKARELSSGLLLGFHSLCPQSLQKLSNWKKMHLKNTLIPTVASPEVPVKSTMVSVSRGPGLYKV